MHNMEDVMARKYSTAAQGKVGRAMDEFKKGELKSGKSGKTVKSRKQAIAIGLSEARELGMKVPSRRSSSARKGASSAKASKKSTAAKKSSPARKSATTRRPRATKAR